MLLHEGHQIYFGLTELAIEYFFALGFEKPTRATTADFLTSLTYLAERRIREGYENRVPRSAKHLRMLGRVATEQRHFWKKSPLLKTRARMANERMMLSEQRTSVEFSQSITMT
jgi:hypothetical protein